MAAQALAAVCVIAVGAHFAGLGYDIMPFAVGAVCLVAACVLTAIGSKGGGKAWMAWAILVCAAHVRDHERGHGSEVDMWSVISNDETQEKTGYASMYPTISVVDSDLMMSVPPTFTAWQGMDAFFHAAESVINVNEHVVGEMFALKAIELIAEYLPRAVADGSDKEARNNMAIANTLAGYYMLCTSEHTMEHALGSAHPELVHGAGLIMISHEYFGFFAERKCCEGQMAKMARAMGVEGAAGGADFVAALDMLIADVNCAELRMSDYGITREELPGVVAKYHEVWGGNNDADPVKLTDEDVLGMLECSYK